MERVVLEVDGQVIRTEALPGGQEETFLVADLFGPVQSSYFEGRADPAGGGSVVYSRLSVSRSHGFWIGRDLEFSVPVWRREWVRKESGYAVEEVDIPGGRALEAKLREILCRRPDVKEVRTEVAQATLRKFQEVTGVQVSSWEEAWEEAREKGLAGYHVVRRWTDLGTPRRKGGDEICQEKIEESMTLDGVTWTRTRGLSSWSGYD